MVKWLNSKRRLKPATAPIENKNVVAPFKVRKNQRNPSIHSGQALKIATTSKQKYEKKHRLPLENYIGQIITSFTICIFNSKQIFVTESIFKSIELIFFESLQKFDCESHIHLFMPNHCHLLIGGKSPTSNLWKCIFDFKQRSGYWLSKNNYNVKWQKDFYDHTLRKDEDIVKQVRYILENPIRKGIVDYWKNYKFKGSTT